MWNAHRMTDPWDGVAWCDLVHAYGSAANLPGHFTAWLGGTPRQKLDSGDYLSHANFAFGLWPATAPTAAVLAGLLDSRDLNDEEVCVSLRFIDAVAHLADLGDRAEAVREQCEQHADDIRTWTAAYAANDFAAQEVMRSEAPELMRLVHEASQLACFDVFPKLAATVVKFLDDERIVQRGWIAATLAALARHPSLAEQRPEFAAHVEHLAHAQRDERELATLLLALGDLGGEPRAWLTHPHLGVKTSAALAQSMAGDSTAARLRENLLQAPGDYFASFSPGVGPAQFMAPPYDTNFGEKLLQRARACSVA